MQNHVKNISQLSFSRVLPLVSGLISTIVITRHFSLIEYGMFGTAVSALMFISIISQLGVHDYLLTRDNYNNEQKSNLLLVYKMAAYIFGILVTPSLFLFYAESIIILILILVVLEGAARRVEELVLFSCQLDGNYQDYIVKKTVIALANSTLKIVLILVFDVGLVDFVFIVTITLFLITFLAYRNYFLRYWQSLRRIGLLFQLRQLFLIKSDLVRFALISISHYLYFSSDTFMISLLSSEENVALYTLAYYLMSAFLIPTSALWTNFINHQVDHKILKNNYNMIKVVLISIFCAVMMYLCAWLYVSYINSQYYEILPIMAVLCIFIIFKYMNTIFELFEIKSGRTNVILKLRASAASINVVSNCFLILEFGALGAAITTLFLELFIFAYFVKYGEIRN